MKNMQKYLSVIVIGLIFVCMIPSVLHAAKESNSYNNNPKETSSTEEAPNKTPTAVSTEPTEPATQPGGLPARAAEKGVFVTGDASYFDDALFIGDSRTADLCDFGTLKNADYYATVGMSVFNIHDRNSTHNPSDLPFSQFIKHKRYGKVYIMLGLNECTCIRSKIVEKYQELIDQIREAQPNAIIYIQANLLITAECSKTDKYSHNPDLIEVNNLEAQLANGKDVVYIDINNLFCLPDGTLDPSKTGDGTHIYAKYCKDWCNWLMTREVKTK